MTARVHLELVDCVPYRARIRAAICAKRHRLANGKAPPTDHDVVLCRGCAVGAARARDLPASSDEPPPPKRRRGGAKRQSDIQAAQARKAAKAASASETPSTSTADRVAPSSPSTPTAAAETPSRRWCSPADEAPAESTPASAEVLVEAAVCATCGDLVDALAMCTGDERHVTGWAPCRDVDGSACTSVDCTRCGGACVVREQPAPPSSAPKRRRGAPRPTASAEAERWLASLSTAERERVVELVLGVVAGTDAARRYARAVLLLRIVELPVPAVIARLGSPPGVDEARCSAEASRGRWVVSRALRQMRLDDDPAEAAERERITPFVLALMAAHRSDAGKPRPEAQGRRAPRKAVPESRELPLFDVDSMDGAA